MDKAEIYKRIMVCEKKERDFLEVGNTRTANRYHNEIQKWEKLLNQLNPKMEQELNEYRRSYYKQKEVIDKITNNIQNDIDGFITINDHGECNDILELLEIYLDILNEVAE